MYISRPAIRLDQDSSCFFSHLFRGLPRQRYNDGSNNTQPASTTWKNVSLFSCVNVSFVMCKSLFAHVYMSLFAYVYFSFLICLCLFLLSTYLCWHVHVSLFPCVQMCESKMAEISVDRYIFRKEHTHLKKCTHIDWKCHTRQIYLPKGTYTFEELYTCILKEPYSTDISVERGVYIWIDTHMHIERAILDRYICLKRHVYASFDRYEELYTYIYWKSHIRQIYLSKEAYTSEKIHTCTLKEPYSTDICV